MGPQTSNEDERPELGHYLVFANISSSGELYVGFAYAGVVVGWAWGFTGHGHAHSVNAMPVALNATKMGIGNNFVAREVLRAQSVAAALALATVSNQANGQHFNMGNAHESGKHYSVETAPGDMHSRYDVTSNTVDIGHSPGHYYHVNFYRRLTSTPITPFSPSSTHRWKRLKAMASPQTKLELLQTIS